jgi:ferredoxin-NADP reductase
LTLKLIQKTHLTDNIWSFQFEPQPKLSWTAGQYIRVELPHANPDGEGTKRYFTVSSAPFEEFIQITTRVSSTTFKQALVNLSDKGELTLLKEPDGDFVWEETDKPRVFVAAGIGVTPYRSILAQRGHDHLPLNATLVYANRTDNAAFREELDALASADPTLKIIYSTGLVTVDSLGKAVPGLYDSLVYVSGPEPLVETLGDTLKAAGLPEDQLKQDFFPNYNETNF